MSTYSVDSSGYQHNIRHLDAAAGDIGTAASRMPGEQCSVYDVYGGEDSGPAFERCVTAWHDEADVLRSALEEIANKLRVTGNDYGSAEDFAAGRVHGAAAVTGRPAGVPAAPASDPSPFG
ncbi:type VII secretion target [Streptomyces sp. NPDC052020]|uniref:WXG100 family type VII secretion target n=1 Tax=Streptomyces sp. NPDC052020 TaxID=3155677 RepID=UPI0034444972